MAARPDWLVDTDESENGEYGAVENESAYREVCRDGLCLLPYQNIKSIQITLL
jgi:hypothetical protein